MDEDRFAQLTDAHRDCLRLVHAHLQIKQIAVELGIAPSTVNARLEKARRILGATSSRDAARLFALYEQSLGIWIPPTGSWNPIPDHPASPPESGEDTADDLQHVDEADGVASSGAVIGHRISWSLSSIRWPFPTAGRKTNDIAPMMRLAWVPPVAAISLLILVVVALLSVAVQDLLATIEPSLARLL